MNIKKTIRILSSWAVAAVLISLPMAILAVDTDVPQPTGPANLITNPLKNDADTIPEVVKLILEEIVMPLGAVVIVFMIIYSGFNFVMARGSEDKLKEARTLFKNVLIGSAIILGAVAITELITRTLGNITDALE